MAPIRASRSGEKPTLSGVGARQRVGGKGGQRDQRQHRDEQVLHGTVPPPGRSLPYPVAGPQPSAGGLAGGAPGDRLEGLRRAARHRRPPVLRRRAAASLAHGHRRASGAARRGRCGDRGPVGGAARWRGGRPMTEDTTPSRVPELDDGLLRVDFDRRLRLSNQPVYLAENRPLPQGSRGCHNRPDPCRINGLRAPGRRRLRSETLPARSRKRLSNNSGCCRGTTLGIHGRSAPVGRGTPSPAPDLPLQGGTKPCGSTKPALARRLAAYLAERAWHEGEPMGLTPDDFEHALDQGIGSAFGIRLEHRGRTHPRRSGTGAGLSVRVDRSPANGAPQGGFRPFAGMLGTEPPLAAAAVPRRRLVKSKPVRAVPGRLLGDPGAAQRRRL